MVNLFQYKTLGRICYCTVGINTGYIKNDLVSRIAKDSTFHKMINGRDISPYCISWKGDWIKYDKDFVNSFGELGRSLPPKYIFDKPKILVQRTRRGMKRKLVCTYDEEKYYNLNRLSNIILKDENYSLKAILAILNSRVMDYYFNKVFNEYEVKPLHLSLLPIKQFTSSIIPIMEKLVDDALNEGKMNNATKLLELVHQIDQLVYQLYDLAEDKISIIEDSSK